MSDLLPNTPEFSVSELAGAVKKTLEGAFGRVRVRGEITEFKAYASGHQYFALKDEGAKIRAIIWKGVAARVGLKAENGVEVIATGRITSYPERSEYQLIVERLEYAGAGALLARIEALKAKLAAEGLFAPERRRPLPMLPRLIGVVTSAAGRGAAGHQDHHRPALPHAHPALAGGRAGRRGGGENRRRHRRGFPLWPPGGPIPRPDVLIVARGGGSLEDLMAFNDEIVVRAAAACTIPLISAVGHETDTTLIDFVSDRRAPTPTAAAEMAIPARLELLADLAQKTARLTGALSRIANTARLQLNQAGAKLPDLPAMLGAARQRLDDRAERLTLALPNYVAAQHRRMELARQPAAPPARNSQPAPQHHRPARPSARERPAQSAAQLRPNGWTPLATASPPRARKLPRGATAWPCWRTGWTRPCPAVCAKPGCGWNMFPSGWTPYPMKRCWRVASPW